MEIQKLLDAPSDAQELLNLIRFEYDGGATTLKPSTTNPTAKLVGDKMVIVKDENPYFKLEGLSSIEEDNLGKIMKKIGDHCKLFLTDRLPVILMLEGQGIRHHPLYFDIDSKAGTINVKFTELGRLNTFDHAMSIFERTYPVDASKQIETVDASQQKEAIKQYVIKP